jgi:hypothetical protein
VWVPVCHYRRRLHPNTLATLPTGVGSRSPTVRSVAAHDLGHHGVRRVLVTLPTGVGSRSPTVRSVAARDLGHHSVRL